MQIETNGDQPDNEQAYAAGFLEGFLTKDLISLHILNTIDGFCNDTSDSNCKKLFQFLEENFNWMNDQINNHPDDPYWHQVSILKHSFHVFLSGNIIKLMILKGETNTYSIRRFS